VEEKRRANAEWQGKPKNAAVSPATFEPLSQAKPVLLLDNVILRIDYPAQWFLFDISVEVFLDDQPVGKGSVKQGIDITVETHSGNHEIMLKMWGWGRYRYALTDVQPGQYCLHVHFNRYSRDMDFQLESLSKR
jgi:hypothetical protein